MNLDFGFVDVYLKARGVLHQRNDLHHSRLLHSALGIGTHATDAALLVFLDGSPANAPSGGGECRLYVINCDRVDSKNGLNPRSKDTAGHTHICIFLVGTVVKRLDNRGAGNAELLSIRTSGRINIMLMIRSTQ